MLIGSKPAQCFATFGRIRNMSESFPGDESTIHPRSWESKEVYADRVEKTFQQLEAEQNPMIIDAEANELLLLVLRRP